MTNPIVTVNVSQQVGPTPSGLQKLGAILSQGGTTLAQYGTQLLTQMSDLTGILAAPLGVTSITWSGGTATVTTATTHGITVADTFLSTIAGANQAGYNGTYLMTVTGASTFTYTIPNPGTSPATGTITYTARNVAELVAMATTFFGQGTSQSCYVLELGAGEVNAGVTALTTFIGAQPSQPFYSYLVPRAWDANANFLTFLAGFESNTSKTYFFVTTTTGTYTNYTALMKCVFALIEAPTVNPGAEFSVAAAFYAQLNNAPSSANKVPPFAFTFVFGVTPYPTKGNNTLLAQLKAAFINIIGTGAEGGISNTILLWGTMADGNDLTYWYSIDWVQINVDLALSNAIINGSNNSANPLYYNQDGINRLQAVLAGTMASGVTFGLVNGAVKQTQETGPQFSADLSAGDFIGRTAVNAVPFVPYLTAAPGDYKIGKYAGFTIVYTPNRGFIQIIVNVIVTQFVVQ